MMASWMLYTVAVTALWAAAAWAQERALKPLRVPTRWGWAGAMAGSVAVSLLAWFRNPGGAHGAGSAPAISGATDPGTFLVSVSRAATPPSLPPDLDLWFGAGWAVASAAAAVLVLRALLRLRSIRVSWSSEEVDGRGVLVSDGFGPALVGLFPPAIVLPRWALRADPGDRDLMVRHEEEHRRAGDAHLLSAALLATVALPWNLPFWWLGRRLRLAVEVDCDRRVLRRGPRLRHYANLLITIGSRSSSHGLRALAFSRPVTFLERRIRAMTDSPSPRPFRILGLLALAALGVFLACEMNGPTPVEPEPGAQVEVAPATAATTAPGLKVKDLRVRPAGEEDGWMIAGAVLNAETEEPVAGVQVILERLGRGSLTNSRGLFLLAQVPSGDHQLVFHHDELGETSARIAMAGTGAEEAAAAEGEPDLLPAPPESRGTLVGSVVHAETGEAVGAAQVYLPELGTGALTNRQGRFLIVDVAAGTHLLHVEAPGLELRRVEVTVREGETTRVPPVEVRR